MRGGAAALAVAAAAALIPAAAEAHLVATGFGPLYDGAAHCALTPEDLLPVLALGLYVGRRGPRPARLALAGLAAGWLAAGALVLALGFALPPLWGPVLAAGSLLAIGGGLAADLRLPSWACAAAGAALGALRGAADLGLGGAGGQGPGAPLGLLGMVAVAAAVFALAASISLPLRRQWMMVGVRVAGSWVAAAGLLMLGWLVRYGARVG